MLPSRTKPRKKSHAVIGIVVLIGLISLVIFIPPQNIFVNTLFFALLLATLFYLLSFVLNHPRRALLLSLGTTFLLLLRAFGLRHWLYLVLTIAILISLELYFRKK